MTKQRKIDWLKKMVGILIVFAAVFYAVYAVAAKAENITSDAQKIIFPIGCATLIAGLCALWIVKQVKLLGEDQPYSKFYFPVFSALLALVCMCLCYSYVGMWPIGTKSAMIVDMHHQYAPLLAQLRDTLLNGDTFLYSFDLGLGASYIPLAGYYLASPLNFILLLFPLRLLDTAILVITLLKNMLCALFFAMAMQYIYGKRTYAIPVVSVMFSMMMYLISYSWNIMWLDVVMMLPLCIMGFEMLMREKKCFVYVISLAYALFANYYIAFMLCVFLVLYYIVHLISNENNSKEALGNFVRFGSASVLAAMLAAVMIIPVALSLGHTSAADGGFASTWKTNFDFLDLLGRHLYDVSPTIRSGNMPNIYCGVLAAFLVPIFATCRSISGKRRGALLGLLFVMALSLTINNLDLFWHGLHSPNDLPYRFSFLYSFALLLIAYEALTHIEEWEPKQIGLSLSAIALYIFIEEKFGEGTYEFKSLYISLGLVAIYAIVTILIRNKKLLLDAGYGLLLSVVVLEMVSSSCSSFIQMNKNEYYTAHSDYTDNNTTKVVQKAVEEMERIGDEEAGEFYRLELLPRRTCADTAMFDYNGITIFASSNRYEETKFMGGLGYAVNGVNSFLYHHFVPFSDSLLGIRYVALTDEFPASKQLVKRFGVSLQNEDYGIYENKDALSVGYFVDSAIKDYEYDEYNPLDSNNTLAAAMTGNYASIYEYQQVTVSDGTGAVNGIYGISSPSGTSNYDVHPSYNGRMYVYVDCRAAESISINAYYNEADGTQNSSYWGPAPYEPYIVDVGDVDTDDVITVTIDAENSCGGNIYACILNENAYSQDMEILKANQMTVDKFSDTKITGNIVAPRNGVVFTSVPYDEGWTVKVDNKKVETFAAGGAMVAFDISGGTHNISMTFFPAGLGIGIVLTILAILILVFLFWAARHPEKVAKAKRKGAKTILKLLNKKGAKDEEETPAEEPVKDETPKKQEEPVEEKQENNTPVEKKDNEEDWFE